jgi:hypothetical protein
MTVDRPSHPQIEHPSLHPLEHPILQDHPIQTVIPAQAQKACAAIVALPRL